MCCSFVSSVVRIIHQTPQAPGRAARSSLRNKWNYWERLKPLEPWIETRGSNGNLFPTIPDGSTGFEASSEKNGRRIKYLNAVPTRSRGHSSTSLVRSILQWLKSRLVSRHKLVAVFGSRGIWIDGFNYLVPAHSLKNPLHRVFTLYPG